MLRCLTLMGFLIISITSLGQEYVGDTKTSKSPVLEPKMCVSPGILNAGSLVGVDLEFLVYENIGLQIGAGFVGFDAGLTVHFKPSIRSSFLVLNYTQIGAGTTFVKMTGASFVYRGKKWFTASMGLGFPNEISDEMLDLAYDGVAPDYIITYAIGAYFPF